MKKVTRRVILPASLAALLIIILAVTGHIRPAPPSDQSLLKIIIYTDFECGACARFNSEIEPELRSRYEATGKMQIEIRLLGAMSPDATRAAEAALCAGDQGRFLEYQDAVFAAWREEEEDYAVFSIEALTSLAAALDLDEAAFATCLNSEAKKAEVEENMNMAQVDGVSTLPAVLVGNFTIQGYKPLDTYVEAIEEALAAQRPK
ncbi:MAG: thioredoxin domain-containing protein [Dehalococcoidia bacterium]